MVHCWLSDAVHRVYFPFSVKWQILQKSVQKVMKECILESTTLLYPVKTDTNPLTNNKQTNNSYIHSDERPQTH